MNEPMFTIKWPISAILQNYSGSESSQAVKNKISLKILHDGFRVQTCRGKRLVHLKIFLRDLKYFNFLSSFYYESRVKFKYLLVSDS